MSIKKNLFLLYRKKIEKLKEISQTTNVSRAIIISAFETHHLAFHVLYDVNETIFFLTLSYIASSSDYKFSYEKQRRMEVWKINVDPTQRLTNAVLPVVAMHFEWKTVKCKETTKIFQCFFFFQSKFRFVSYMRYQLSYLPSLSKIFIVRNFVNTINKRRFFAIINVNDDQR